MNIDKYFNMAKESSRNSDYYKIHIGACLVYKNRVIATGYNSTSSHPMQKHYNIFRNKDDRQYNIDRQSNCVHAEIACLIATRHLNIDYTKCSIFVYREDKSGSTRLSRCCGACEQALIERGIKNLYYTTEKGYNYERIGE